MAEQSAKSFLSLLEKSGIVAGGKLKKSLAQLADAAEGAKVDTKTLSSHLVDSGLVTSWHVDKLLGGKYKGFFLGKFKLLGHLGSGGMSSVYLAQHKVSEQTRAIKVLPRKRVSDKSYLDRFYREGQAAAALNHPNVVRIYDICNEADTHYMVMEHVKGADLYEVVKDSGRLAPETAAEHILQAAAGLQHAHDKNMVHRDIKPANLLRTDEGVVKILDLGLALVQQEEEEESLTVLHNEKVMGTADYLSPEQAVNSHNVDHRADIYSLGCTLYFLLVGKPPFSKGSLAQRIAMHQTQDPKSILEIRPEVPEELVRICEKMMRKDPDERYANCEQISRAVAGFLQRQASTVGVDGGYDGTDDGLFDFESGRDDSGRDDSGSDELAIVPPSFKDISNSATDDLAADTISSSKSVHSEFAIDTESVSSKSGSFSSKTLASAPVPKHKKTKLTPKNRPSRGKKKAPLWVISVIITAVIALLVGVLVFVIQIV